MSKGVKSVLSIAAAVAIPFAAPAIASSIGLSSAIGGFLGSATAGSAIGGGVTGAALGAASAGLTDGDIRRGALMGGIGGGIGGYASAPTPAAVGPAGYVPGGTAGAFGPTTYVPVDAAGAFPLSTPGVTGGLSYAPTALTPDVAGGFGSAGYTPGGTAAAFGPAPVDAAGAGAGLSGSFGVPVATPVAAAPRGVASSTPGTFTDALSQIPGQIANRFTDALSQIPGQIANRFTDPKALADLTLRAAGQLAGSALAGSGLSAEEQALLNEQTEELRQLQQSNQALFNQRLEQAQNLMGESKYFDPEYFGLQSARRAQIAGAQRKRGGLRGLTGDRREAEARRFDLETGRSTGTAFDTGFQSAIAPRIQTQQAGLSMMPQGFPSSSADFGALRSAYDSAATRRAKEVAGIQTLMGSLTETPKATSKG